MTLYLRQILTDLYSVKKRINATILSTPLTSSFDIRKFGCTKVHCALLLVKSLSHRKVTNILIFFVNKCRGSTTEILIYFSILLDWLILYMHWLISLIDWSGWQLVLTLSAQILEVLSHPNFLINLTDCFDLILVHNC